jgi:senataxin
MKTREEVYSEIIRTHQAYEAIPGDLHLFCPKINDDDDEEYGAPDEPGEKITVEEKKLRIEEAQKRLQTASWMSLILGLNPDQSGSWKTEFIERTEEFLKKCDSCVLAWQRARKDLRNRFLKEFDEETTLLLDERIQEFDTARIDAGLSKAVEILEERGSMSPAKLLQFDQAAVIALYEALCCVPYLSVPKQRQRFDIVFQRTQEKKPFKMGNKDVVPTMTVFLFQEDHLRQRFARTQWDSLPPQSMTADQFEWSVSEYLTEAIQMVNRANTPYSQIQLFWEGFLILLDTMSEDLILHSLRGMQTQPDVYGLAISHLVCDDDRIVAAIVKVISALLEKSSRAFWDALSTMNPPQLPQFICQSPAFNKFLVRSFEEPMLVHDGSRQIPILVDFVRILLESLPPTRRTDVCDSLLSDWLGEPETLRSNLSPEGQAACRLAGLTALRITLYGFLDAKSPQRLTIALFPFINPLLNCVVKYKGLINDCLQMTSNDRHNYGLSEVAMLVVEYALTLDARALREEWRTIEQSLSSRIPEIARRQSAMLWAGLAENLRRGIDLKMNLTRLVLIAMIPLRGTQQFAPDKNKSIVDSPHKKAFNSEMEPLAKVLAEIWDRVSEFSEADLRNLCSDTRVRTIDAIIAAMLHGEECIRQAGAQVITALTGEFQRSEAIVKMIHDYPAIFVVSFSDNIDKLTSDRAIISLDPWAPQRSIQICCRDVLNGLCDTTQGLLRQRPLTEVERRAVRQWWGQMWQFIDYSFQKLRHWSHQVAKPTLEDHCRDVMELAEALLAQDGLVASALSGQDAFEEPAATSKDSTMREVLDSAQRHSQGFVDMIQLKDLYLLGITVSALVKLFTRLKEFDMVLPKRVLEIIRRSCKSQPNAPGRYLMNTNLNDTQRAELLKALGDESDSDVEIIPTPVSSKVPAKKQTSLEAWSRGGSATSSRSTTPVGAKVIPSKDLAAELTPNAVKYRAMLEKPKKPIESKTLLANRQAILDSRAREKAEMQKKKADAIAKAQALRAATSLVSGEGSGLQNVLGVPGIDHAPKKSELMVDSDSESSGSDAESDALVHGRKPGGKSLEELERRRRLALQPKGPVKKLRVQRSAKDRLARVTPPMGRLHQAILEWDIFHDGNDPPNGYKCENVADTYPNPVKYKDTFFPLLISEAWRSFVTSKDESTSKAFGIRVITRMSVDNFMEVSTTMPAAAAKERGLSEGDIILISQSQNPLTNKNELHCLARIWKTTFKKENMEVAYRLNSRGNQILPALVPGGEFHAVKITNMTTIEREFAALESLQHYDLMDEIMTAKPSPMLGFGDQLIQSTQHTYELNRGQAVAILNAKENDGFTLIQGPPGTGKTKTIVAMVGVLLTGVGRTNTALPIGRPGAPTTSDRATAKKLLVCAPSNAAVDEIVLRLKSGIKETNGSVRKINVLRLGRSDAINAAVKDVTLDELVKAEIDKGRESRESQAADRDKLHKRAGEVKAELAQLSMALEAVRSENNREAANKIQREYDTLKAEQRRIGAQIDKEKDSGNTYAREAEIRRRQIQQRILNEAHVLCATLSGSGHEMFKNLDVEFETVIIDEAAQCVELSALIPLKYGCAKCVLVGDPKQLPPTVLSQSAAQYGYDQSLFVRMQHNHPKDVHLLDTQYRMHPEISMFPSKEFYERRLIDGGDMAALRRQPWHRNPLLGPYRFFDVEGVQEKGHRGQSLVNVNEIQVALQLYKRFRSDYSTIDVTGKIGIITPYKAQLMALRQRFSHQYGEDITNEIEFNTTDAFQGRECEIIIFSCVRASPTGGIGFMTDIRRMNVGLTRARSSLWILGDSRALRQGQFWHELIKDAKSRDRYTTGNIISLLRSASKMGDIDVEMVDAPVPYRDQFLRTEGTESKSPPVPTPGHPSRLAKQPPPLPASYTVVENHSVPSARSGGINEKGEALSALPSRTGPPVIRKTSEVSVKRHPDANDLEAPPAKRVSHKFKESHDPNHVSHR